MADALSALSASPSWAHRCFFFFIFFLLHGGHSCNKVLYRGSVTDPLLRECKNSSSFSHQGPKGPRFSALLLSSLLLFWILGLKCARLLCASCVPVYLASCVPCFLFCLASGVHVYGG